MKLNISKLIERLVVLSVAVGSIVSVSVTFHTQVSQNIAKGDDTGKDSNGNVLSGNSHNDHSNNGSYNGNHINSGNNTENIGTKKVDAGTHYHNSPNVNCHQNTRTVCNNYGPVNMGS